MIINQLMIKSKNSFNKHSLIKSKSIALKSYHSPWLNNTLRDCINEKHWLDNLHLENPEFVTLYKRHRNLVSNEIKLAKMQFYKDKFNDNLNDAKSTWKVINKILKPNSRNQNEFQVENNGTKLNDSTEIANAFNDYFSSWVAPSLASQIPVDQLFAQKPKFLCLFWCWHHKSQELNIIYNINLPILSQFLPLPTNILWTFSFPNQPFEEGIFSTSSKL